MTAGRDYPFFLSTSAIQYRGGSRPPKNNKHRRVAPRMIPDDTRSDNRGDPCKQLPSDQFIALAGQICHFENCDLHPKHVCAGCYKN